MILSSGGVFGLRIYSRVCLRNLKNEESVTNVLLLAQPSPAQQLYWQQSNL